MSDVTFPWRPSVQRLRRGYQGRVRRQVGQGEGRRLEYGPTLYFAASKHAGLREAKRRAEEWAAEQAKRQNKLQPASP